MKEKDKLLYEKSYKEIRDIAKLPQEIRDKLQRDKGLEDLDENKEKVNWEFVYKKHFFKNQEL